jgi:Protein of unknown function (DUF2867)
LRLIPRKAAWAQHRRMTVRTDTLPRASTLWSLHQPGDFLDCYSVASTLSPRDAAARGLALPGWAQHLLGLRNLLVRPFGLKTGTVEGPIFPTCHETADEIILGTDDRHLNFRIGVIRQDGRLYMSTWVHPHNLWGRAYLRLVLPFHILISRGAVARMASGIDPEPLPNP